MTSSLGLMNLLEQFTELRETFYLLDHEFTIKGCGKKHNYIRKLTSSGEASMVGLTNSETESNHVGRSGHKIF